jgi:predicted transcriptional regulator
MLETLETTPDLDLIRLAKASGTNFRNASEHARRLESAGLIFKRSKGRNVLHSVSPLGNQVLAFLRELF